MKITIDGLRDAAERQSNSPDELGLETYEQVEAKINDKKESFMNVYDAYQRYLERVEREEEGEADPNHFEVYSHLPRQPFTVDQFFDYIKGTEYDPDNWSIDQLEEYYFTPVPEPFSQGLYTHNLVAYRTLKKLGFSGPQQRQAAEKFNVSAGEYTLEWMLPSPTQFHTFEEPAIIKEPPSYQPEDDE